MSTHPSPASEPAAVDNILTPVQNASNLHLPYRLITPIPKKWTARTIAFSLTLGIILISWVYFSVTLIVQLFNNILTQNQFLTELSSYATLPGTGTVTYTYDVPVFSALPFIGFTVSTILLFVVHLVSGSLPNLAIILMTITVAIAVTILMGWWVSLPSLNKTVITQVTPAESTIEEIIETTTPTQTVTEYSVTTPDTINPVLYIVTITEPSQSDTTQTITVQQSTNQLG